jgi:CHAT domain-containing protein/tetratricopeptide (TPR) repeat protein
MRTVARALRLHGAPAARRVILTLLALASIGAAAAAGAPAREGADPAPAAPAPASPVAATPAPTGAPVRPLRLAINEPVQVTAEADAVRDAAVSPDGRWIVYAAGPPGARDLWLRSTDPGVVVLPRRLTAAAGDEQSPAFSRDGRRLVYVGTGDDARGDLVLLELDGSGAAVGEPARLTGRETDDGAPAFAAGAAEVYFQQARPGEDRYALAVLDLATGAVRTLDTGGDAEAPAVSPDGRRLVFVSRRRDPGGDLYVLELSTGLVQPLTDGRALDGAPVWVSGGAVLFVRRALDTDGDGWVTPADHGVICRVILDGLEAAAGVQPLTASSYTADMPRIVAGGGSSRLFFVSSRSGAPNVWSLPADGEIPELDTVEAQAALAGALARLLPPDLPLAVVAHEALLARFPATPGAAGAALEVGRLHERLGFPESALAAYRRVQARYGAIQPEAALAAIQAAALGARLEAARDEAGAARALEEALGTLDRIAGRPGEIPIVQARARIEQARLLLDLGPGADGVLRALGILEGVVETWPAERAAAAEATVLRADAHARLGQADRVRPAYLAVLERYPEVDEWADRAIARILELALAGPVGQPLDDRVATLRSLAAQHRTGHPRLAMGALNRAGDLLFAGNEWARARAAYRQVLDEFPETGAQTAAARLALAEILYREERFREALDLYETELRARPVEDRIYRLARRGYLRKSVASGEALLRLGEAGSARSLFRDLLRYDAGTVEAHRGYLRAAAALGDTKRAVGEYRAALAARPEAPVLLYATALGLTYLDTRPAMEEARDLLTQAIARQGQVEYFHQTLGYVLEVLETVHGERGGLELAAEAYRRALFLNRLGDAPENAANLLLNLGNVSFLLGNHAAAYEFYAGRVEQDVPFEAPDTEILYYRRFAASAFQVGEPGRAVELYERGLGLVRARAEPRGASGAFDALIRAVLEGTLPDGPGPAPPGPAGRGPGERAAQAEERQLAEDQADVRARLHDLGEPGIPAVPSPGWERYRAGIEELLGRQEAINRRAVALARTAGADRAERLRQSLEAHVRRTREALRSPVRHAELEAELLDRLGLACQEAGRWEQAAAAFEAVLALNRRLGLTRNLAVNRRSAAYSTYRLAGERAGQERVRLLERAASGFREALELVHAHGVPDRQPADGDTALVSLRYETVSRGTAAGATRAAFGFTREQEVRLGETFLGRIATELGDLDAAARSLEEQLGRYPPGQPVAEGDLYGVSLLAHRAGLLAFARDDPGAAFDHFRRSAALARQLGNGASAALNVANMARVVRDPGLDGTVRAALAAVLRAEDEATSRLLTRDPVVSRQPAATFYHEALGVYWLGARPPGRGVEAAAGRMDALARAAAHFTAGLAASRSAAAGGTLEGLSGREPLARVARLSLGLARVAGALGEHERRVRHLEEALRAADRGLAPEVAWRALAGLGRHDEALAVLDSVSPLRAASGPGEITGAFAPLVEGLVARGEVERAFDLAERLSELERVHRMAPLLIGTVPEAERQLSREAYPRILRIRELEAAVAAAKGEEKTYQAEALARERQLLAATLGASGERLPALVAAEPRERAREAALALLGLAVHAEDVADAAARARDPREAQARRDEHRALRERWAQVRRDAIRGRDAGAPAGLLAVLGPEPAEAAEVQASLADGEALIRLVRAGDGRGFLAFTLTADGLTAGRAATATAVAVANGVPPTVVVHDDPVGLAAPRDASIALSATHWLRAFQARRPFKRSLVVASGPGAVSGADGAPPPPGFDPVTVAAETGPDGVVDAARDAHTLVLRGRIRVAPGVPTRAGDVPGQALAMDLAGGRLSLVRLMGGLPRASLVILAGTAPDAVYPAAHLLALAGCPSVVTAPADTPAALRAALEAYAGGRVTAAATRGTAVSGAPWLALGFRGVGETEARALAEAQFAGDVKAAREAMQASRPLDALARAEDALLAARESAPLGRHLTELLRFAREAAWAGGRLDVAERHAADLAGRLERERPDSDAHADALLRLGLVQARLERYPQAVTTLERAQEMLAALDLPAEHARVLASLGIVLENATEYDRALRVFESAAAGASGTADQAALLAAQHGNIGRLLDLRLSQWARARQSYERALGLHERLGNRAATVQTLIDIGRCARLLGDFAGAERHYARALAVLAGTPDDVLHARILIERANSAWFQGRYQEAFELQRQTLDRSRTAGWDLGQVIALNTSGLTWWTLGDTDRALRELTRALELARSLEGRQDEVATTLNNIGLVYREMGRYDAAVETLDQALAIDRKLRSRWAVAYDLRNLGLTLLRRGETAGALPLLREAAAEAGAIGDAVNEAKALLALGEALLAAGQASGAGEAFGRALERARAMSLREVEWRALHGQARLALEAGQREAARGLLGEAVEVIERLRAAIKLEQLRDGFLTDKLEVYESLVAVLVELGDTTGAFTVAERSRARNFIDLLGAQRLSLSGAVDQALYDRERALAARIDEQRALAAQARTDAERATYRQALQRAEDGRRDLLLEIQARAPGLASLVSVTPLPPGELQALLEPGVVILAYYLLPREVLCWVVTRESVTLVRTAAPREALERQVFDYRRRIQNLDPLEAQSRELHRVLIAPVEALIRGGRHLGIVPHGALHYLSFATLAGPDAFLIDEVPLFSLPSASVLPYTLARRRREASRRVLAIGNPRQDRPGLALPFAEHEVGTIRWNLPGVTVLTGDRATESWVRRHASEFGIIHLAAHGEFDPINPLFSAVKLARDAEHDGEVQAAEIFGLELNADLVVLSACQTAVGRVTRGDDVIGLGRAFFYAGTHALVATLWRVNDAATAMLMKQFYREYRERDKAASLRAAMLHVKQRHPHPGYWGAFVLAGDYQ